MKKKQIVSRVISCSFMAILIAGAAIGTNIAYDWEEQLNALLAPPIADSGALNKAKKNGQKMAKQVETEGAVLLENNNNVLPLSTKEDKKVNVFGYASVDWSHGGLCGGSSGVVSLDGDVKDLVNLNVALKRFGISYNKELEDTYKNWCKPMMGVKNPTALSKQEGMTICEMEMDKYGAAVLERAKAYSNTAIVVISRSACEGMDILGYQEKRGPGQRRDETRTFLQISKEEEDLLKYCGENYEKVVVVLNTPNQMECGFMKTIPGLDSLVHVSQTGTQAASAIPALLYGQESFSGRLADSYPYKFNETSPAGLGKWFGATYAINGGADWGSEYVEGIYVGYKWYETAYHEGVWDNVSNEFGTGYDGVMQYPFGHGLSYSTFDWKVESTEPEIGANITANTKIKINVNVTNTGEYRSRDVVQAYLTAPYTDGGIEKSYVNLVGFAKTKVLEPNESETVTVEIDAEDFMSYDCYDKNNNGFKGSEALKDAIINYNVIESEEANLYPNSLHTGAPVGNLFTGDDAVDGFSIDGIETDSNAGIPYMSRADFATDYKIPEKPDSVINRVLSAGAKKASGYNSAMAREWDNATTDIFGEPVHTEPVTWGKNSGLKVAQDGAITELGYKLGADYNDPQWDTLLDQVPIEEAYAMIGPAFSGNKEVPSVGKPRLYAFDSMIQMKGFTGGIPRGTGNPSTVVLAQTFNKKLMYDYASNYADEMISLGITAVFGPGVNIHRSAYTGRNWEYFSEDTYLTTVAGCLMVRGLQDKGRGVEMKHLAVNETESGRWAYETWLSEQAFRETYLKPFQKAFIRNYDSI